MNLMIADEEFERGAKRILDMSEELNDIFHIFALTIFKLRREGICDIAINSVLAGKVQSLTANANEFSQISAVLVDRTKAFLVDIDKADAYLY